MNGITTPARGAISCPPRSDFTSFAETTSCYSNTRFVCIAGVAWAWAWAWGTCQENSLGMNDQWICMVSNAELVTVDWLALDCCICICKEIVCTTKKNKYRVSCIPSTPPTIPKQTSIPPFAAALRLIVVDRGVLCSKNVYDMICMFVVAHYPSYVSTPNSCTPRTPNLSFQVNANCMLKAETALWEKRSTAKWKMKKPGPENQPGTIEPFVHEAGFFSGKMKI